MKSKQLTITDNNINTYMATEAAITLILTWILGPVLFEAIGLAYVTFGTAMGAVIGGMVGKYLLEHSTIDIAKDAAIGSAFGSIAGLVVCKIYEQKHKEANIDQKDFAKGADCAFQAVATNFTKAIGCGKGYLPDCYNTSQGFDQITKCMGEDDSGAPIIYAA